MQNPGGLLAAPNTAEVLELLSSTLNAEAVDDFWVGIDDMWVRVFYVLAHPQHNSFKYEWIASTILVAQYCEMKNKNISKYFKFISSSDEEGVFRFSDGTTFTKTGGEWGADDITW